MSCVVAVMGADQTLGRDIIELLDDLQPDWISELRAFGTEGGFVHYRGEDVRVQAFAPDRLKGTDIALLAGEREVAEGAVAIQVADARLLEDTPVVVPTVNPDTVDDHRGIIAVPDAVVGAVAPV